MNLVCNKRCIHGVPRSVMFFYPPWVHVLIEMGRGRSRVRPIFLWNKIFIQQDIGWSTYWNYPFPTEPSYIVLQIINTHFNFY